MCAWGTERFGHFTGIYDIKGVVLVHTRLLGKISWIQIDIMVCSGPLWHTLEESGNEIMMCENLNNENRTADIPVRYDWFYSGNIIDLVKAGKVLNYGLKGRQKILETGIT